MKIINRLSNKEMALDDILALYTGEIEAFGNKDRVDPKTFENVHLDDLVEKNLVLHELNLLQRGYTFWAKAVDPDSGDIFWYPAKVEH